LAITVWTIQTRMGASPDNLVSDNQFLSDSKMIFSLHLHLAPTINSFHSPLTISPGIKQQKPSPEGRLLLSCTFLE